jgi:hypothetical protein
MAAFTSIALAAGAAATVASGAMASSAAGKASKAQQQSADAALNLQREQFDITREDSLPFLRAGQNANAAYAYEMGLGPRPTFGQQETPNQLVDPTTLSITEQRLYERPDKMDGEGWNAFKQKYGSPVGAPAEQTVYSVGDQQFGSNAEAQNYLASQYQDFNAEATAAPTGGTPYGGFKATPGYDFRVAEGQKAIERSAAARGGLNSGATLKSLQRYGQDIGSAEYGTFMNRLAAQAGMGQTQANSMAGLGQNFANSGSNTLMAAGQAKASGYVNQGNIMGSAMGQLGQLGGNFIGGMGGGAGAAPSPRNYSVTPNGAFGGGLY